MKRASAAVAIFVDLGADERTTGRHGCIAPVAYARALRCRYAGDHNGVKDDEKRFRGHRGASPVCATQRPTIGEIYAVEG